MQHLWTLALAVVFAWSGESLASLPTTPSSSEQSVTTDDPTQVARRRKRKKKKRKKRRKRKGGGAVAPAPPPDPPPPDDGGGSGGGGGGDSGSSSGGATAGDSSGSADWGSSDWASPDWAGGGGGGGSSSSSSNLLDSDSGGSGGGDDKPVENVEKEAKPKKSYKKKKGVAGAWVLFSPIYSGVNRKFVYTPENQTSTNLRPYEASFVSMVGGRLELYPGVLLGIPILDMIGVRGGYRMALGLKSAARTDPNTEYGTTFSELDVDLAGRFTFGDAILTVGAGFGMLTFAIDAGGSALEDQVQDLGYSFIRAGVDFRYQIGQLSILVGGAYRHVLSTGELGDSIFPDSSAMGFDAGGGVAFQIVSFAEAFATFQFAQFSHSLTANATYDANGATDRYLGGQAGITLFF